MTDTAANLNSLSTRATLLIRLSDREPQPRELAWREFVRRYAPIIRGFARKLGCPAGELDEIAQEVVVGFYAASPTFHYDPSKGRFRGYLKTCTMHAIQRLRRRSRGQNGPNVDELELRDGHAEQTWNDLFDRELLRRAIEDTRDQYKNNSTFQAWRLLVIDQLPTEQVAQRLKMSLEAVYKAKQRIGAAVKARFIELGGG